jgi:hypothetical protein
VNAGGVRLFDCVDAGENGGVKQRSLQIANSATAVHSTGSRVVLKGLVDWDALVPQSV